MEKKEIVAAAGNGAAVDFGAMAQKYLSLVGQKIPDDKAAMFLEISRAYGLNPFKREIYCIAYGNSCSIITGYEVYVKRAERTGKLDGWSAEAKGEGANMTATVTIWRKDWSHPFVHTVNFAECNKCTDIWRKMPAHMLKKVAISQGFRLCFPDELGGMPYTADEMDGEPINVTPASQEAKPAPAAKQAQFKSFEDAAKKTAGARIDALLNDAVFTQADRDQMRELARSGKPLDDIEALVISERENRLASREQKKKDEAASHVAEKSADEKKREVYKEFQAKYGNAEKEVRE